MDEPTVVIYEAPNEAMSLAVKDALIGAGIPVSEQVDRSPYAGDISMDFNIFKARYLHLLVPESRAEEARQFITDFLAAYEKGELALPEDDESAR